MARSPVLLLAIFIAIGVCLLALNVGREADAQTEAPTPSPSPTAGATPGVTPFPTTTRINIRFVQDGQPVEVYLLSPIYRLYGDGEVCNIPIPTAESYYSGYTEGWPPFVGDLTGVPVECYKGPPTEVKFEFVAPTFDPSDPLFFFSTTVTWLGEDLSADLEIPDELQPSATPSPTASAAPPSATSTPTAAALPDSGGTPNVVLPHGVPLSAIAGLIGVLVLTASLALISKAR